MSYFTAALVHTDDGYRPLDLEIDDAETMADLVELIDAAGDAELGALAVIEHEDEWFALVRVLPEGEVKVFLSDIGAVADSPYAELFADCLDSQPDAYEGDPMEGEEDYSNGDEDDDEEDEAEEGATMLELDDDSDWGGDPDIFAAEGIAADELIEQVREHGSDPARVVAHVGEKAGFAEQLEAAR